jgi:hypothetical protein
VDAYSNKPELLTLARKLPLDAALLKAGEELRTPAKGDVKMIYLTAVGDGPRVLAASESLIDATGFPLEQKQQKWQQTLGSAGGDEGGCPVKPGMMATVAAVAVGAAALLMLLKKSS